ncbi:MAG: hypothetical protein P1U57_02805 [Oleibacter sp.]|nr:hypothetical protein [Thalassolituus sp.]
MKMLMILNGFKAAKMGSICRIFLVGISVCIGGCALPYSRADGERASKEDIETAKITCNVEGKKKLLGVFKALTDHQLDATDDPVVKAEIRSKYQRREDSTYADIYSCMESQGFINTCQKNKICTGSHILRKVNS